MRSVVVSGIGVATTLGLQTSPLWKRLNAGERGYSPSDPHGRVHDLQQIDGRAIALVQQAARSAMEDAEVSGPMGVAIGSSRGLQADWERTGGLVALQLDAPARAIAALVESTGPVSALACACATGSWSIAQGYRWIRSGLCDRVIVGAVDAAITDLNLAGFRKAGSLSPRSCRPFDCERTGFILAEGAAVLILEAEDSVHRRPYARVRAFAATCDAYHPTAPHPEGEGLERAIHRCLAEAGSSQVDAVIAHGSGTRLSDPIEAAVIERVYGAGTPIAALKGSLGHSLGASSAIEAVVGCLALQAGGLPPVWGLERPIRDLRFVREASAIRCKTLMLHSLGFGGQNTALLLEAIE